MRRMGLLNSDNIKEPAPDDRFDVIANGNTIFPRATHISWEEQFSKDSRFDNHIEQRKDRVKGILTRDLEVVGGAFSRGLEGFWD